MDAVRTKTCEITQPLTVEELKFIAESVYKNIPVDEAACAPAKELHGKLHSLVDANPTKCHVSITTGA